MNRFKSPFFRLKIRIFFKGIFEKYKNRKFLLPNLCGRHQWGGGGEELENDVSLYINKSCKKPGGLRMRELL